MNPILARLKALAVQPSTYRGVSVLLGLLGITAPDALVQAVGAAVITLVALYDVSRDERQP